MSQGSSNPISAESKKQVDQVAASLVRGGWRLPALIVLEAGRPLAFLGGQLLWLAQPALSLFMPGDSIRRTAEFLEDPEMVDALRDCLETAVAPSDGNP
jgi:hypothetical protein